VDSEGDVGESTSLTLDSLDLPHISYSYNMPYNLYLKYAHWNGYGWYIETVDSTGHAGNYTLLALDSSENHIFHITAGLIMFYYMPLMMALHGIL